MHRMHYRVLAQGFLDTFSIFNDNYEEAHNQRKCIIRCEQSFQFLWVNRPKHLSKLGTSSGPSAESSRANAGTKAKPRSKRIEAQKNLNAVLRLVAGETLQQHVAYEHFGFGRPDEQ